MIDWREQLSEVQCEDPLDMRRATTQYENVLCPPSGWALGTKHGKGPGTWYTDNAFATEDTCLLRPMPGLSRGAMERGRRLRRFAYGVHALYSQPAARHRNAALASCNATPASCNATTASCNATTTSCNAAGGIS